MAGPELSASPAELAAHYDALRKRETTPSQFDQWLAARRASALPGGGLPPAQPEQPAAAPAIPLRPAPALSAPTRSIGLKPGGAILAPFAIGNAVPGGRSSIEGVQEEMARRFTGMAAAMPPELRARLQIISGERTPARQIEVYRGSGTPPPMNSRHIHGQAMDLGNDPAVLDWINQHGREHGLGFPLRYMGPKEYNHLEMVDNLGGRAPIGGRVPIGGGSAVRPEFGGGSDAAPVYAETGDPQFKSGLVTPTSTLDEAPAADPAQQAALAALALQQTQSGPFGASGGGFSAPTSLGDAFAQVVKAGQPAAQPPSTILPGASYPNVGGPIPLARRIG